jgi:hypothetical protein
MDLLTTLHDTAQRKGAAILYHALTADSCGQIIILKPCGEKTIRVSFSKPETCRTAFKQALELVCALM